MATEPKLFSQEYFESGENISGQYSSYSPERFYPAFGAMANAIEKHIKCNTVLDIGCAKGYLVDVLRQKGFECFGTDISEYAIRESPKNIAPFLSTCNLNHDLIQHSDSSFDLIICMGTLEYVENQKNALDEIRRVLKNGGIFLMTTLNYVPEGDEFRKYARTQEQWDASFAELGFSSDQHALAHKVISRYVRKIILFDFGNALKNSPKKTLKFKMGRFVFLNTVFRELIIDRLFRKQVASGYLMLGYKKD